MNKEIDWHGIATHMGYDWIRVGDCLVYPSSDGGAWPRDAETPCGWDERDAQV